MLHCVVHLYYVPGSEKRDILRCACFKDMYGMEDLNKKVGCLQRRRYKCRYGRPKQSPDLEGSVLTKGSHLKNDNVTVGRGDVLIHTVNCDHIACMYMYHV